MFPLFVAVTTLARYILSLVLLMLACLTLGGAVFISAWLIDTGYLTPHTLPQLAGTLTGAALLITGGLGTWLFSRVSYAVICRETPRLPLPSYQLVR